MTYSMTAFARKEKNYEFGTLQIEIKSVNQRYLEPSFRLHDTLRPTELKLRELLKQKVKRGKVEITIKFRSAMGDANLDIDKERLKAVTKVLENIQRQVDNTAAINPIELMQYPGVLVDAELDLEQLHAELVTLFDLSLDELLAGRQREGEVLNNAIKERLTEIEKIVANIRAELPEWVQAFRDNLKEKVQKLGAEVDPDRLEQEVVLLAQKADVSEELDRLDGHIKECQSILKQKGAIGRKLDFLMQEFNREANTLGSKSTKESITRNAVQLKVLIEQMREQVQNIE